jgi:diaminopimelate decarboxylase
VIEYRNGTLYVEDTAVADIAEAVGTPLYIYSNDALLSQYRSLETAFAGQRASIFYAVKANSNLGVIATFAAAGAGADVVSEGEMRRALAAGIPGERIVFSGVGKTREEMAFALRNDVHQLNVESEPELEALNIVAASLDVRAPIAIRINPDVDAGTLDKISTGKSENKFGIPWRRAEDIYRRATALSHIDVVGVAVHIGSQITDLAPFESAFRRVADVVRQLRASGIDIRRVDLGGGLGIAYDNEDLPSPVDYAAMVDRTVGDLGCDIALEPGRYLVGNAGLFVTRIIYMKNGDARTFAVLDGAMNDLLRPALYEAHHETITVREPDPEAPSCPVDLVGPVCESTDTFATNRDMPLLDAGDMIAFKSAGAYSAAMASTYNSRPLVPEVLVKGEAFSVVRERQSITAQLAGERQPPWLD